VEQGHTQPGLLEADHPERAPLLQIVEAEVMHRDRGRTRDHRFPVAIHQQESESDKNREVIRGLAPGEMDVQSDHRHRKNRQQEPVGEARGREARSRERRCRERQPDERRRCERPVKKSYRERAHRAEADRAGNEPVTRAVNPLQAVHDAYARRTRPSPATRW
jgi:hypothetical protein